MESLLIKVLHSAIWIFNPFCCCDFDLDPMTFIYELVPYSMEMYLMSESEPPTSRLSKVTI